MLKSLYQRGDSLGLSRLGMISVQHGLINDYPFDRVFSRGWLLYTGKFYGAHDDYGSTFA